MNKKIIISVGLFVASLMLLSRVDFGGKTANQKVLSDHTANVESSDNNQAAANDNNPAAPNLEPADQIEVVHFHGTYQCWSCTAVGEYALKTIEQKFPQEYESGRIVFKEINAELPENSDIAAKFQARGSSLFINAVRDGEDDIAEETDVWRLVNNEERFINHLAGKLNSLLNK